MPSLLRGMQSVERARFCGFDQGRTLKITVVRLLPQGRTTDKHMLYIGIFYHGNLGNIDLVSGYLLRLIFAHFRKSLDFLHRLLQPVLAKHGRLTRLINLITNLISAFLRLIKSPRLHF
jgi:hypothetical protein